MHTRIVALAVVFLFGFVALDVSATGYMKIGDIKGESIDSTSGMRVITPTAVEVEIVNDDETGSKEYEDDWEEPQTADGGGDTVEVTITKEVDKSSPKIAESVCNGKDDDCDGPVDEKAGYILCPDGTMIQPGEKCPEEDTAVRIIDNGGITAEDDWEEPRTTAGGNAETTWKVEKGEKATDDGDHQDLSITKELDKSSPKIAESVCDGVDNDCDGVADRKDMLDWKVEEGEKAAYILCPDGTMIQPGEKCPETENPAAYIKIEDIKAKDGVIGDFDGDGKAEVVVTKEMDKSTPKLFEGAHDDDSDDDSVERRRGDVILEDVTVTKEIDKSSPKIAESLTHGDDDQDDPENRAAYIKIGDIKGEAKDDEPINALDPDSDCDGLDDDCDGARAPGNHNTTRSNRTQPINEDDADGDGDLEVDANSEIRIVKTVKDEEEPTDFSVLLGGGSDDSESASKKKPKEIVVVGSKVRAQASGDVPVEEVTLNYQKILLSATVPDLLEARKSGNESSAIGTLRAVNNAQGLYEAIDEDPEKLGNFADAIILSHPEVKETTFDTEMVSLSLQQSGKLFGLIPIKFEERAEVSLADDPDDEGRVKVHFPWYSFLVKEPVSASDRTELIEGLLDSSDWRGWDPAVKKPIEGEAGDAPGNDLDEKGFNPQPEPPGAPSMQARAAMSLHAVVEGLKASHDVAMNSIRNMK